MTTNLFVAACALWYVWTNVVQQVPGIGPAPSDFTNYWLAARAVVSGLSPFTVPDYIYPPLTAVLLAPLGLTDYVTARWIWFVLSHLCLLGAACSLGAQPVVIARQPVPSLLCGPSAEQRRRTSDSDRSALCSSSSLRPAIPLRSQPPSL